MAKKSASNLIITGIIALGAFLYFAFQSHSPPETVNAPESAPSPVGAAPEVASSSVVDRAAPAAPSQATARGGSPETGPAISSGLPADLQQALSAPPPTLPPDLQAQLNAPPPELPEDLKRQLANPPTELPADLQAQLNAPPPEIPEDIRRALTTPPRTVTLDEVNTPPDER